MTHEEIQAVYASGPEAVIALVEFLLERMAEQEQIIAELRVRVKELEDRLATDSHNSSQPPSSDRVKPQMRSLRPPSGKRPGGQPGHPGRTLRMVETPNRVVIHRPTQCQYCGASLKSVQASESERRQVFDLPPMKLEVVEHEAESKRCRSCQQTTKGQFPEMVSQPVQYGERIKALGVYLMNYQLLPYERTSEVLGDLFGCSMSAGTLYGAAQACAEGLTEIEEQIKQGVRQAEVAHFDETGLDIEGKRQWLHVSSTQTLTHYGSHPKRGKEATESIGILPEFDGTAVHDGWGTYRQYACAHALCNAHHLRELTFIEEQDEQVWAGEMKGLLVEIKQRVEQVAGMQRLDEPTVQEFEQRYQQVLDEGLEANPKPVPTAEPVKRGRKKQSKAKNLVDRLSTYREQVLAFMYDFRVPFDNNLAERDLRMMKVKQKISGCFRCAEGATSFCRIRSYISTSRKQGKHVLSALESVFTGKPFVLI